MKPIQGVITVTLQHTDQGGCLGGFPISPSTHPSIIFYYHLSQFIHLCFYSPLTLSISPSFLSTLSPSPSFCHLSSSVHFLFLSYLPFSLLLSISLSTLLSLTPSLPMLYIRISVCWALSHSSNLQESLLFLHRVTTGERQRNHEKVREREREEVIISESQKLRRLSTRTFCLFEIHCNLMLVKILLSFSSQEKDNNVFCVCSGHLNTKVHLGPRFWANGPECTSKKLLLFWSNMSDSRSVIIPNFASLYLTNRRN